MYLVIKRYEMDDGPAFLTDDKKEALEKLISIGEQTEKGCAVYATEEEQDLMDTDIGTELCDVAIISFDKAGKPIIGKPGGPGLCGR